MLTRETRWHTRWHTLHSLHTMHTRERRLSLVEVLLVLLGVAHAWRRLKRRRSPRLVADALISQHSLNLVQAHNLPRGDGRLSGTAGVLSRRGLVFKWLLALSGRLLRLQAPNIGARLQLRNIVGVLVAFITGPGGPRGVRNGRLLLLLGSRPGKALARLKEHLFFLHGAGDLGRLTSEVEVPTHALLGGRTMAAEGIIVEGIVGVVELSAQTLVRVVEINAVLMGKQKPIARACATYTSSSAAPPLKPAKASCWPKPGALV